MALEPEDGGTSRRGSWPSHPLPPWPPAPLDPSISSCPAIRDPRKVLVPQFEVAARAGHLAPAHVEAEPRLAHAGAAGAPAGLGAGGTRSSARGSPRT